MTLMACCRCQGVPFLANARPLELGGLSREYTHTLLVRMHILGDLGLVSPFLQSTTLKVLINTNRVVFKDFFGVLPGTKLVRL